MNIKLFLYDVLFMNHTYKWLNIENYVLLLTATYLWTQFIIK